MTLGGNYIGSGFAIAAAALISYCAAQAVRKLVIRFDVFAKSDSRRRSVRHVPLLGGAAVLAGFGVPYLITFDATTAQSLPVILGAGALVFLIGFIDDLVFLRALPKLTVEVFASALVVAYFGLDLHLQLGGVETVLVLLVSMAWIVGLTNSFNLLDGLDGLCGGTAVLCASALVLLSLEFGSRSTVLQAPLMIFVGSCTGFLLMNRPPARIYLGDCGSLFIGFLLASSSLEIVAAMPSKAIVLIMVFAVPILDTLSVIFIRLRARKPVMDGDQNHLHHRLRKLGLSGPHTLGVLLSASALSQAGAFAASRLAPPMASLLAMALFGLLAFGLAVLIHFEHKRDHWMRPDAAFFANKRTP